MTITSNGMGATRYNASVEAKYYVEFLNSKSRGFQVALLPKLMAFLLCCFLFILVGLVILMGLCKDLKIQMHVNFPKPSNDTQYFSIMVKSTCVVSKIDDQHG